MPYSKKQHLQQNLAIIREVLSAKSATPETIELFRNYSGFGALKCVLLPAEKEDDKKHWVKSELDLFPLVRELHTIIRERTYTEDEYKMYIDSIKNSVLSAFYTPTEVVQTIAKSLSNVGITAQSILEPSAGVGQFVADFKGTFPQSKIMAYEKDLITGKILQYLYQDEKVRVAGFETIAANNSNRFDLVTSNIPFGDVAVPDPLFSTGDAIHRQAARSVHNYFFVKGLDTLREGGLLAFITSQGVADAPTNQPIREYLVHNADKSYGGVPLTMEQMRAFVSGETIKIGNATNQNTGKTETVFVQKDPKTGKAVRCTENVEQKIPAQMQVKKMLKQKKPPVILKFSR